jgi:hypothetical protein
MIRIVERSSLDEACYNSLQIRVHPQPIYTSLKFIDAIAKHTNSKVFFVVSTESGTITASLPFCIRSGVYGPVINSLPFFGSHGGVTTLRTKPSHSKEVIDALVAHARAIDCAAITVIEPLFNREPQEIFKDFDYRDSRIGLYNEVHRESSSEDIMKSFDSRARNSIRKALGSGIEVVKSHSLESIEFLARSHVENMNSLGRKAKDKSFFFEFLHQIPNDNWIILEAHLKEERIASLLLIFTPDIIEYFTPVTVDEHKRIQPMSLLIFQGFLFAKEKQIRYWNWGGTWMNQDGVYKFKKQWNPKETKYFYYTKILNLGILGVDSRTLLETYPFFYVYPMNQTINPGNFRFD